MNPPDRWSDDRLDDLAADVRHLSRLPERMTVVERELVNVARDTQESLVEVRKMSERLVERDDAQRVERKSDRRWLVGTGLTSAALVIAALGLLADKL